MNIAGTDAARYRQDELPRLRSGLRMVPQGKPNQLFFRIEDHQRNRFYRLGVAEYEFLTALDGTRTITQARQFAAESNRQRRSITLGQAETLLRWAFQEDLVSGATFGSSPATAASRSTLTLLRLPLLRAGADWTALGTATGWLFSGPAILFALLVMLCAIICMVTNWPAFREDSAGLLSPDRVLVTGVTWCVLKVLHEMGHLVCCQRQGGKIGELGVAWMLIAPVAYVDLTDLYRMPLARQRILTYLGGIYIELLVAAISVLCWTSTESSTLRHLSATVAVTAGLGSLLFNLNPLMKLDGYYVLCECLHRPHLASDANAAVSRWLRKWLIGQASEQPESVGILVYGIAMAAYRILLYAGLFSIAYTMYGLTIAAIVCLIMSIGLFVGLVKPLINVYYACIARPASFVRLLTVSVALLCIASLGVAIHRSWNSTWHAVVEHKHVQPIRSQVAGRVMRVLVCPGQRVTAGTELIELENRELVTALAKAEFEWNANQTKLRRFQELHRLSEAASQAIANDALRVQVDHLRQKVDQLMIRAPWQGVVLAKDLDQLVDCWCKEGQGLLHLVDEQAKKVVIAVPQGAVANAADLLNKTVWVAGQDGTKIKAEVSVVTQQAESKPPHAALAATAGGPLAVRQVESQEATLLIPCLRVEALLQGEQAQFVSGQMVRVWLAP